MKKIILLSALTVISAIAVSNASAQDFRNDKHAYGTHAQATVRDRDAARDYTRRIDEIKREMDEEKRCGDWNAYRLHQQELDGLYRDLSACR